MFCLGGGQEYKFRKEGAKSAAELRLLSAAEPAHLSVEQPPPGWWAVSAHTCTAGVQVLVYFYQLPFSQLEEGAV